MKAFKPDGTRWYSLTLSEFFEQAVPVRQRLTFMHWLRRQWLRSLRSWKP